MPIAPKDLNALIEQDSAERDFQQVKFVQPEAVQDIDPGIIAPPSMEQVPEEDKIRTVEEPVQVAGGKIDFIVELAKKAQKRIETAEQRATPMAAPEAMEQVGEDIIVRQATPAEQTELAATLGIAEKYTKGLNLSAISEAVGDIDMAAYLQKIKDDNADLFETVRRGTISYESLLKMAEEKGIDNIVREFIRPGRKEVVRAEDILAGLIGAQELSKRTTRLAENALRLNDPESRAAAIATARRAAQMEAMLYAQISGEVSEAGRTQFAMREAQRTGLTTSRGEELEAVLTDEALIDDERFLSALISIPEGPGKAKFLQRTWYDKGFDFLAETYTNSILTLPVSHAVNIGGNATFSIWKGAEEAVAASFGLARSAITGNKDRVQFREAFIQLDALRSGFIDAAIVGAKSLKRGEPLSEGTKIDVRTRRAIGTTDDFGEVLDMYRKGDIWTGAVNTFGIYNRMGFRFLTAEDEFFKAIQYQAEIKKAAHLRGLSAYDVAIDSGKTPDEARVAMAEEYARIMANPPKPIKKTAADMSKEITFQSELGKSAAVLEPMMSHPLTKLVAIPFFKTPTNVMKQTFRRSPFAIGHTFYDMMSKGGREADLAFGRFATGTAVFSAFAFNAFGLNTPDNDIIITGSPLADREAQQARQRLKIQDFSVNIKQEDGLYKSYTYSRFDPLSGLLAMSSDYAYYSQFSDDKEELADLAAHAGLALFNYSMEMPFLQGVSELGAIFSNAGTDNEAVAERLSEFLAKRATEVALSPVPTVSSFMAGVERVQEPGVGETRILSERFADINEINAAQRGFYLALQKAMDRNPFFSDKVPPRLNLWGEQLKAGAGVGWEMINPVRIKDAKYEGVDKELMRLGDGLTMPQKTIDGVKLSAEQYNRWIVLTAQSDYSGLMPGDAGYKKGQTLQDELKAEIFGNKAYRRDGDNDKLDELRNILSARRRDAREVLEEEYPDLKAKIDAARIN